MRTVPSASAIPCTLWTTSCPRRWNSPSNCATSASLCWRFRSSNARRATTVTPAAITPTESNSAMVKTQKSLERNVTVIPVPARHQQTASLHPLRALSNPARARPNHTPAEARRAARRDSRSRSRVRVRKLLGRRRDRQRSRVQPANRSEIQIENPTSASRGCDDVIRNRTNRASYLRDDGSGIAIGSAESPIPASRAFTAIRSAIACSSESPESYPNTILGEPVICDQRSFAPCASGSRRKQECSAIRPLGEQSSGRLAFFLQNEVDDGGAVDRAG